jgi:NTE family protein
LALAADLTLSSVRIQMAQTLKVLQGRVTSPRIHNVMEHGRLLAEQEYKGDINIHPQLDGWMYRRLLANPSVSDLKRYISLGERATWPKISMIRNQTRIQSTLAACVKRLEASAG